jgi:hypothetical protein
LSSRFVIGCEGEGDDAFLKHLIATRSLGNFDVQVAKGNRFGELLTGLQAARGVERVMIVTDSDDDGPATFKRIQTEIRTAGLTAPDEPLTLSPGALRVAVMLLPWHDEEGNLEVLCLRAMNERHENVRRCVDQYIACYPAIEAWRPGPQAQLRVRVMLSTICASDPNTALRYAWNRSETCIELTHPCFDRVSTAIRDFGLAT